MALSLAAKAPAAALQALFAEAVELDVPTIALAGPLVVVAPHPDDESLGCGGLLALLGEACARVVPVLVTDGEASHPNSRRHDAAARGRLRAEEWRQALGCLGLDVGGAIRLGLADGDVPRRGDLRFEAATDQVAEVLARVEPATLLLPWRRDPHPDHRATHAIVSAALLRWQRPVRRLEYLVWTGERASAADLPLPTEVRPWRLDIGRVVGKKCRAIAAHRSQHGEAIDDDAAGFRIDPAMRARAEQAVEHYLESFVP